MAAAFVAVLSALAVAVQPTAVLPGPAGPLADAALGALVGLAGVLLQAVLPAVPLRALLGGFAGALMGALGGRVLWWAWSAVPGGDASLLRGLTLLALIYAGAAVGVRKASAFRPGSLRDLWEGAPAAAGRPKILDTSVIIDGRITDIMENGFMDGRIVVPEFVLRELQQVADSGDALKRARGRRGLETLQGLKKVPSLKLEIPATDFPEIPEVDLKLIELARTTDGKIVTTDLNLNKVARVRDIPVLNINELANSLRPVVLPGESMRVFILKAGKEPNQGVAYLDDGTMVVVDDGKSLVGQTVEVVVTSVLQTTAGKMFFGRCDPQGVQRRESIS